MFSIFSYIPSPSEMYESLTVALPNVDVEEVFDESTFDESTSGES